MIVSRRRMLRRLGGFAAGAAALIAAPRLVVAAADARQVAFHNIHNDERISAVYWSNGAFDDGALRDLDFALRDWRNDQVKPVDRALFDLLHELATRLGSNEAYEVISAYRSPETNAMLAAQSNGVATHSLHLEAKAMDIALPSGRLAEMRDIAWDMQLGGVGWYADQFVHVDTGRVRRWNF